MKFFRAPHRMGGERHDRDRLFPVRPLADDGDGLDAGQDGHLAVHDDEIKVRLLKLCQSLFAIFRASRFATSGLKQGDDEFEVDRMVLRHENPIGLGLRGIRPGRPLAAEREETRKRGPVVEERQDFHLHPDRRSVLFVI